MKKARTSLAAAVATFVIFTLVTILSGCSKPGDGSAEMQTKLDSMQRVLDKNLATFDTLDLVVFNKQDWARMHESHAPDVKVTWPDGHTTTGLEQHVEDLKDMFEYAPDTRVTSHPIRFGSSTGEWTCVSAMLEGTFTKPMYRGHGTYYQPTGRKFKLSMCTVGHWKNGVMIEESFFWDHRILLNQLGLDK